MAATPLTTPLPTGTQVFTVGTFYPAEVVSSEVGTAPFLKVPMRRSVVRWTESIPAAGVVKGETDVMFEFQGRVSRFCVSS
ncbi:hypothetical protein ACIOHS_27160 [Streptomyces sp. NPDC088253]|uniref:hypothetical protein n=1 Tax=Streptomyces sp. NPDC088253 TaxID=3365846 RepID=UPI0038023979